MSGPRFDPLWAALRPALSPCLIPDDLAAFEAAARDRLGAEDPRPDDPGPQLTPAGRCFARKRFRDVRVGDFLPASPDADLDYDDRWCRVERFDPAESGVIGLSLRDADGQRVQQTVADGAAWVAVRSREPWNWGLPG